MKPNMKRPPLKVSSIPSEHVQLREGERKAIVCPDCDRWHPIRRGMVWAHHLERTERGTDGARCPGSARRVEIDVDIAEWGRKIAEAHATVASRRSTRVNRKPRTTTPPPVTRLATAPKPPAPRLALTLERAQNATVAHRDACRACRQGGRCKTGRELEVWHAETAATARHVREQQERTERHIELRLARERAAAWRKTAPRTRRVDTLRMERLKGTAPVEGPDVPLEPLHLTR
ncbi:hypothetical protein HUF15_40410 [Streptomyces samsunensis]|uniref:hypothetical protein n=1 Tax=Streptomyces malaysiensis TaxID=92644 RepID=UPI001582953E|nr:hypothetical protein [Streptomyces samsunensis]NUH42884.1 hypothetical protein [Streptomyces samsunensis]